MYHDYRVNKDIVILTLSDKKFKEEKAIEWRKFLLAVFTEQHHKYLNCLRQIDFNDEQKCY
jgi:hypothetical protein